MNPNTLINPKAMIELTKAGSSEEDYVVVQFFCQKRDGISAVLTWGMCWLFILLPVLHLVDIITLHPANGAHVYEVPAADWFVSIFLCLGIASAFALFRNKTKDFAVGFRQNEIHIARLNRSRFAQKYSLTSHIQKLPVSVLTTIGLRRETFVEALLIDLKIPTGDPPAKTFFGTHYRLLLQAVSSKSETRPLAEEIAKLYGHPLRQSNTFSTKNQDLQAPRS